MVLADLLRHASTAYTRSCGVPRIVVAPTRSANPNLGRE
jgi:hypothetical protein